MPPAPVVYSDEDDCAAVARSGPSLFAGPASSRLQVHRTAGHRDTEGFHVDVESFQGYRLSWRKLPLVLLLTSRRDTIARVKTFVATIPVILTGPKFQRLGSKPASVRDVRVIDAFYMRFLYCPDLNTFVPVPGVPHEFSAQLVEVAAWLQQRTDTAAQLRQPPADLVSTFPCSAWDRKERRQIHFYQYYWWALVIGAVTLGSVGGSVVQTYSNKRGLNTLVRHVCNVDVVQPGRTHSVKSTELVPGDIVVVKQGRLPCDMVLLWGRAIVDENALTGESVPIRKSPFLSQHAGPGYRAHVHAPCTLQSGTQVLQVEGQGVISWVPTAVMAHKFGLAARDVGISFGNMVIIALPPALVTCLAIVTACSIFRLYRRRISVSNAARIKAAGHVSVVCFDKTGTITEAGMHLKGILPVVDDRIAGLQVHHYNWSPAVRMLLATCHSLISVDDKLMGEDLDKQPFLSMGAAFVGPDLITLPSLPEGGVQRASKGADEQVSEEALEDDGQWLSILRQFEFSSTRQRIVLVTKALDSEEYIVNAKGSPEAILPLVDRQSIPLNFHKVLDDYASQGFRMMAMATGRLPRDTTPEEVVGKGQQEIEEAANLMFLGLCVIINKLHPESKGALKRLHNRAQMRTVMVTGDHVNTSISVAKMCGMLYERRPICVVDAVDISPASSALDLAFTAVYAQPQGSAALSAAEAMRGIAAGEYQCAVTGRGFVEMLKLGDPELTAVVLQNVVVAARMLPNHKQDLVALLGDGVDAGHYGCERIQGLGNYVAFCGDGLNDMVALKAASVGVSLCAGGANSPAAPFTAHQRNVGSMAAVLAEGRCTLVITYFMFQYMAVYSVNQAVLTNILAFYGLAPSNNQYLLMDILFVFVFTTLVARTEPTLGLTREKPPPRLLSPVIVLPCLVQAVMATAMQLGAIGLLQLQAWYRSTDVLANPALQGGCAVGGRLPAPA
ncbi:hypothetical protein WJX72_005518 [[Myrmecia] bisecta]|uniref:P-type ATPase A domain-containing protein n=1 Tax=[Myrmecia] bisecta TaxID=41462 RepID=A0AAW1QQP1_9CHLO